MIRAGWASSYRLLAAIWPSLVAALLVAVGAVLSMGLIGLVLYYLASPALTVWFPPLAAWDQSLVWPAIIAAPIVWAPAFVLAGVLNDRFARRGWRRRRRILLYLGVLWLWAVAAWSVVLIANPTLWR
jgi:hypothetical protein